MTLRDSPLRWWLSVLNAGMPAHVVAPQRVTQRLLKLWRRRDNGVKINTTPRKGEA